MQNSSSNSPVCKEKQPIQFDPNWATVYSIIRSIAAERRAAIARAEQAAKAA